PLPPPPRSPTRIPYTTLFRSSARAARRTQQPMPLVQLIFFAILGIIALIIFVTNPSLAMLLLFNILSGGGRRGRDDWGGGGGWGGRKSTRLNSSHQIISYAVS